MSKACFPYDRPNRSDRTKQCTGDPGVFMEIVKENLETTEATAAIIIILVRSENIAAHATDQRTWSQLTNSSLICIMSYHCSLFYVNSYFFSVFCLEFFNKLLSTNMTQTNLSLTASFIEFFYLYRAVDFIVNWIQIRCYDAVHGASYSQKKAGSLLRSWGHALVSVSRNILMFSVNTLARIKTKKRGILSRTKRISSDQQ